MTPDRNQHLVPVRHGMLEITTNAGVHIDGASASIDFAAAESLEVNGRSVPIGDVAEAARSLNKVFDASQVVSLPITTSVGDGMLRIEQPGGLFADDAGAYLWGTAADRAAVRAVEAPNRADTWLGELSADETDRDLLDGLVDQAGWDGPLIVSMPRTGSTLLGTLFLLAADPSDPSGFRFDRYIHEPAAPLFWQGRNLESLRDVITRPLTPRDIIQESAYQFAHAGLAKWFIAAARKPIVFVMRHPQISWPSRWRILLRSLLESGHQDQDRISDALDAGDFSDVGDLLATVRPPDNGFFAYMEMLGYCLESGIDVVVVDNARFRRDPDRVLRALCERLDVEYDDAMTTWSDLSQATGRVVMSELASGEEYPGYYAGTFESSEGIVREDRPPTPVDYFPEKLRGQGNPLLSIEEAVTWYHMLLARPEVLD